MKMWQCSVVMGAAFSCPPGMRGWQRWAPGWGNNANAKELKMKKQFSFFLTWKLTEEENSLGALRLSLSGQGHAPRGSSRDTGRPTSRPVLPKSDEDLPALLLCRLKTRFVLTGFGTARALHQVQVIPPEMEESTPHWQEVDSALGKSPGLVLLPSRDSGLCTDTVLSFITPGHS